jgi:hypothetical protein
MEALVNAHKSAHDPIHRGHKDGSLAIKHGSYKAWDESGNLLTYGTLIPAKKMALGLTGPELANYTKSMTPV